MVMSTTSTRNPQTAAMIITGRDTGEGCGIMVAFWKPPVPTPGGALVIGGGAVVIALSEGVHSVSPISFSWTLHSITSLSCTWLTITKGSSLAQACRSGRNSVLLFSAVLMILAWNIATESPVSSHVRLGSVTYSIEKSQSQVLMSCKTKRCIMSITFSRESSFYKMSKVV